MVCFMAFIKLDYNDYKNIKEILEEVEDLTTAEQMTLTKINGILLLMESKRQLEDAGALPARNQHIIKRKLPSPAAS